MSVIVTEVAADFLAGQLLCQISFK